MLSSDYSFTARDIIEQCQWMEVSSSCDSLPICLQDVLLLFQQAQIGAYVAEDLILLELNFFGQSLFAHNDYQLIIIQNCPSYYYIHLLQKMKGSIKDVIIINADDYGYNETTNDGIIGLIIKRKVNSISVIINGDSIDSAATKIKQIWKEVPILVKQLSVGLHFNLTQGTPISKEYLASPLVQNARFIGKPKIYDVFQSTEIYMDVAIRSEFYAQIRKFIHYFGRRPSHIDGHNHVHIIPVVAAIIAKQMSAIGIIRTRVPLENLENISISLNNRFLSYAEKSKDIFQSYNILFTKDFVGLQSFGNLDPILIERSLQKQSNTMQRSVQMMCHPAYPSDSGIQWTKSIDRLKEKEQLESQKFERLFQKYSNYGNYYDLKPRIPYNPSIVINYSEGTFRDETRRSKIKIRLSQLGFEVYFYSILQNEEPEMSIQDLQILVESLDISVVAQIHSFEIKIDQKKQNHITKDKLASIIKSILAEKQTEVRKIERYN